MMLKHGLDEGQRRYVRRGWQLSFHLLAAVSLCPEVHATTWVKALAASGQGTLRGEISAHLGALLPGMRFQRGRVRVVQRLLDSTGRGTYLEIGVHRGGSILPITTGTKIGVDPAPRLSMPLIARHPLSAWSTQIYHMESNRFFTEVAPTALRQRADVVFIDGLHTYEQSLRDLHNALTYLKPDGWIVVHDASPPRPKAAATVGIQYLDSASTSAWYDIASRVWCGDVWKTILHARATADNLQVCVLDTDFGLGVIRRGQPESRLKLTPDQIRAMTYDDLAANREALLNLKPLTYLDELLGSTTP